MDQRDIKVENSLLSEYEDVVPIGRGATSFVYRVKKHQEKIHYALKVINRDKKQ